ncbi:MAG: response regulator transcription factor [Planctomycetota bacterium]|nr:response regulator transcription factor [Planctomycetota bacterium]
MKILIAEDDAVSRHMLEEIVTACGYEVRLAADGMEAWRILMSEDSFKMLLLDWMMPGIDGTEICRRIRSDRKRNQPYIILVTARVGKSDLVTGLDSGANDYLTKPYDVRELRARINVGRRMLELQDALAERVRQLEEALAHVKTLQGILPICMHCHKIRNDADAWERIEKYISEHSDARFSHGICPECMKKYYPDVPMPEDPSREAKGT